MSLLHKKLLVRIGFLLKGPCNIDYFHSGCHFATGGWHREGVGRMWEKKLAYGSMV